MMPSSFSPRSTESSVNHSGMLCSWVWEGLGVERSHGWLHSCRIIVLVNRISRMRRSGMTSWGTSSSRSDWGTNPAYSWWVTHRSPMRSSLRTSTTSSILERYRTSTTLRIRRLFWVIWRRRPTRRGFNSLPCSCGSTLSRDAKWTSTWCCTYRPSEINSRLVSETSRRSSHAPPRYGCSLGPKQPLRR